LRWLGFRHAVRDETFKTAIHVGGFCANSRAQVRRGQKFHPTQHNLGQGLKK
jgi:hypothetical protein